MANDPKDDELVDLDFTGVFKVEELRPEPPPPPPKKMPEEFVIGAKAMKKGSSFINMARARPARKVDPAKTSILLVEDDKTTRIILDMICKKAGFQTRQAADAATFLAAMNKPPLPDAVVLDIELPNNVSGFKILSKMRDHPVLKKIPVVVVTVRSEPEDLMQAMNLGADAYLTKPAKSQEFLEAIHKVLGAVPAAKS